MTQYSVATAKNNLSELIDRALDGEGVIITRHGKPVAEIRPIPSAPQPVAKADLDRLAAARVKPKRQGLDSGELLRKMRDEAEH